MGRKRKHDRVTFKRYFRLMLPFVRPYWKLIALMFLVTVVHSCSSFGRIGLVKPVLDKVFVVEVKTDETEQPDAATPKEPREPKALEYLPDSWGEVEWVRVVAALWDKDAELPGVDWKDYFYMICVIAMFVAVVMALSLYGKVIVQRMIVNSVTVDLRRHSYRRLVSQDVGFFDRSRSGDLIARVTVDLDLARQSLDHLILTLLDKPIAIATGFVFCLAASWKLSMIFFVGIPIVLVPVAVLGKRIRKGATRRQEHMGNISDALVQTFAGIRIIKAFRLESAEADRFAVLNRLFFRKDMSVARARAMSRATTEFMYTFGIALILLITGTWFLSTGSLEAVGGVGSIGMFFMGIGLMYAPAKQLLKAYNHFQESAAGADRLFGVVERVPAVQNRPGAADLGGVEEGIRFENVRFHYNADEPVLRGIDLEIPAGKTVAVVGPSGAGKSTLLDLIPRFYDVVDGAVKIDGRDVRDCTLESLCRNISVVQQDPFVFNSTIRENILNGRPDASEADLLAAAEAAQVMEFAEQLGGLDAPVGERGGMLSGGQRQRLTIARAMLADAPILLLDEATSSLDSRVERAVQQALDRLMQGRTTLTVAHRLSTIRRADLIVVMREGEIVEKGTHDELLARGALYAQLHELHEQADEG